jgi:hypothetical protein
LQGKEPSREYEKLDGRVMCEETDHGILVDTPAVSKMMEVFAFPEWLPMFNAAVSTESVPFSGSSKDFPKRLDRYEPD